ncbi:MAG: hypothetical protein MUO76_15555 [Anaerolineaceae bacterium]|nr:hypothetical protein [Anaerolineaceae bacterium]
MFDSYLLQVTPEELEWFKKQSDFFDAYDEFIYNNGISCSSKPEDPPSRAISFQDYTLNLLMTSVNPPIEGWFSPDEILFSRALVYGKQEIDQDQNLSYNSLEDVANIASELENIPLTRLRVIFDESIERYGMSNSPPTECNEEILHYQSKLYKWVTEFYQTARAEGYVVLIHWN